MGTCGSCQSTCRDKDSPEKADDELKCVTPDNAPTYHLKEAITCENWPSEATCVSFANDPGNFAALTTKQHNTKCTSEDTDKAHCNPDTTCCSSTTCTDATPVVSIGQVADQSSPPLKSEGAVAVRESHGSVGSDSAMSQSQESPPISNETWRPQTPGASKGERFSAKFRRSVSKLSPNANRTMKLKSWKRSNDASTSDARTRSKPSGNTNTPGEYIWLQEVLWNVVKNEAHSLGVVDTGTGKGFTPIFFVIGSCPSLLCRSMQAVMYSVNIERKEDLDFWWVKPQMSKVAELERNTLNRNAKGPHKNDPGRSKPLYKAFADLFVGNSAGPPGMRFGIDFFSNKAHQSTARAYLKQDADDTKLYLHMVWQEDWTSNPFSSKKSIKGKIVYQKDPEVLEFFSRQYTMQNGSVSISDVEGPAFKTILPNDDIKELWESVA